MRKTDTEWYIEVANTLKLQPELLKVTISAINDGIKARLDLEQECRANAETALVIAYDSKGKIPTNQIDIVKSAIKNSKCYGGTPYAEKL